MRINVINKDDGVLGKRAYWAVPSREWQIDKHFRITSGVFDENEEYKNAHLGAEDGEARNALEFLCYLAIGKAESAVYLLRSFSDDVGTKAEGKVGDFLTMLSMTIGKDLGDSSCAEVAAEEPVPKEVETCATKCVKVIEQNAAQIESLGRVTNLGEVLAFGKYFDDKVREFSGHSFVDHIGDSELKEVMMNYIDYTEEPELAGCTCDIM